MKIAESQQLNRYFIYNCDLVTSVASSTFDPGTYIHHDAFASEALGRGSTYYISLNNQACVLRHYCRGGLVAKLIADRYLWTNLAATRAWREWHLLQQLVDMDLPGPLPVAAQVHRCGLFYKADLITQRIIHAKSLSTYLSTMTLPATLWQSIGTTIKQFHSAGVYHADLNAHNILLNADDKVYLIDFDKGHLRRPHPRWQQQNLERLLRSLNKLSQLGKPFYFDQQCWQILLEAYQHAK